MTRWVLIPAASMAQQRHCSVCIQVTVKIAAIMVMIR